MGRDDRIRRWFLFLSVLLHMGLLIPLSFFQPQDIRPIEEVVPARYVVRMPQAAPQRTPTPPMPNPSLPLRPPALAAVQPRQPQPVERSQPRQEPTPVPAITPPQPRPVEPDVPGALKPRPPTPPKSHANAIRRQRVPALPPVAQLPPPPAEASVRQGPVPRQPSPQGQQAVRSPPHQRRRASRIHSRPTSLQSGPPSIATNVIRPRPVVPASRALSCCNSSFFRTGGSSSPASPHPMVIARLAPLPWNHYAAPAQCRHFHRPSIGTGWSCGCR